MQPVSKLQLNIWMLNLASVPMHCCCYVLLAIHFYSLIPFPPHLSFTSLVLFVDRDCGAHFGWNFRSTSNYKQIDQMCNVHRLPTNLLPPSILLQAIPHLSITADVLLLLLWAIVSFLSGHRRRSSFIYVRQQQPQKEEENKEHWWWWPAEIVFSFNRFKRW